MVKWSCEARQSVPIDETFSDVIGRPPQPDSSVRPDSSKSPQLGKSRAHRRPIKSRQENLDGMLVACMLSRLARTLASFSPSVRERMPRMFVAISDMVAQWFANDRTADLAERVAGRSRLAVSKRVI